VTSLLSALYRPLRRRRGSWPGSGSLRPRRQSTYSGTYICTLVHPYILWNKHLHSCSLIHTRVCYLNFCVYCSYTSFRTPVQRLVLGYIYLASGTFPSYLGTSLWTLVHPSILRYILSILGYILPFCNPVHFIHTMIHPSALRLIFRYSGTSLCMCSGSHIHYPPYSTSIWTPVHPDSSVFRNVLQYNYHTQTHPSFALWCIAMVLSWTHLFKY